MAYFIEFGLNRFDRFYAEFVLFDARTKEALSGAGVEFKFNVVGDIGWNDYGFFAPRYQTVASTSTGSIVEPVTGVQCVNIPWDVLVGFLPLRGAFGSDLGSDFQGGGVPFPAPRRRHHDTVLRFNFTAVGTDPTMECVLATGTISIGDRAMSHPRIQLGAYPLFPNSVVGAPVELTQSQYLRALANVVPNARAMLNNDIPSDPDDPNRIVFETSQTVPPLGAFESLVIATLGLNAAQVAQVRYIATTYPA